VERSHLLNTPNSDRTLSTSQTVIAPPQLPKQRTACSSASLSHPSTPKQRTACSSASLSHPSTPQIAIALPPTSQKRTACKQRSHFLQLPKHSFFNEPQRHRGHREREIALPLTSQTANCLQQRFAIAPPQFPNSDSYGALALSHPLNSKNQSNPSNFPNSELLAAALRYRTPSTSPNSDRILPTPQTAFCLQQRFAIASLQLPKSELLAAALRYRIPSTPQKRTACSSASLSHPSNFPNIFFNRTTETQRTQRKSDLIPSNFPNGELLAAALRYRIPSTPQTAN
jgi:hypothetical protein